MNTPTEPRLTGEVVLIGAAPNTTYSVADIQSNGTTDCSGNFRGSQIHTNGKGNGSVKFSVQRDPEFTKFYVAVDTELFNGNPPFVLENAFISRIVELD